HPERTALEGIERFESFLKSIGMPLTLRQLGCDPKDIPYLAEHTKRPNNGKVGFFVPMDTAEIIEVLNIANK
ncbi:MAG: NADH-dependent alcohol dehydrogenase, partial [Clostridia bacterium]|nr:NADH-dependent alcohol dehydrogenase [Clostridia bacterium]